MDAHDSILCVGLDPDPVSIPESLGRGPDAALEFLRRIIRATGDYVCAYKPNLAFYERYGAVGWEILAATRDAIPPDVPVILDAKRGDVPNTAVAYAEALFERLRADAVTAAPYAGLDSLAPYCAEGRFAFVLARTSNPGASDFQDLDVGGRPLYQRVVERCVERFPAERCGFVVGATYPHDARRLRAVAPDRLFLLPGVGAQGGDLDAAIHGAIDARGGGVVLSASRSVLYADRVDFERAAAREAATRLAAASGLTLGGIVSVSDAPVVPFYYGPYYAYTGTFGPGKFCGRIRTPIRRRTASGRLRFTGRFRSHFGCRIPSEVSQTVSATFAVS
jgi:orotidine-5'-phosphate decarboxylase